jgi:hypothetical protein
MNSFGVQRKRKSVINNFQHSVIIGTILGDGYLLKTTRGYCLRLNHSIKQRKYVDWKYSALHTIATEPKIHKNSYYFRTVSHPVMDDYRKIFYRDREKIIPDVLVEMINPIALAVWIMDDGTNELGTSRSLRINTQCFSLTDQEKIIRILKSKFGIFTTLNRDKDRYRIRIRKNSMPKLRSIVKEYIIPSMFYKISP